MATDPTQKARDAVFGFSPEEKDQLRSLAYMKGVDRKQSPTYPDDGNKYIFPASQAAPGSNIAPVQGALPLSAEAAAEDFVNHDYTELDKSPSPVPQQRNLASQVAPTYQADQQASDGSEKLLGQLDKYQAEAETRFNKQEEERAARINETQLKLDAIEKQTPFKFDDRSIWAKQSTGGKIALLIGGFLSAANPGSAEAFRNGVEAEIQRDLAIQNKMMENGKEEKNTLLGKLNRELGNKEAANAAWESRVYKGISDRLAHQRDIAKSDIQRRIAEEGHKIAWAKHNLTRDVATSKSLSGGASKLTTEGRQRLDNAVLALDSVQRMKQALGNGKNTFSLIGDNDFTLAQRKYMEGLGRMQSGGQISESEAENFKAFTPNIKDTTAQQKEKLRQAEAELVGRIKNLGLTVEEATGVPDYFKGK